MRRRLTLPSSLTVLAIVAAVTGRAQTPKPAVDLAGTWTLDTYLSDSPEQVAASIRFDLGPEGFGAFSGMPERRARGMGRRGQPSGGEQGGSSAAPNPEDQRALDNITAAVRYPPPTLQITRTDTSITIGAAEGQSRTFQTSGRREQQMFDDTRADSTARREGPQVVVDFDLGKGRKMTCMYSIVPTTGQLRVRVRFERAPNDPGPFEVKYVYNRAS
jgi:hypothetical protein